MPKYEIWNQGVECGKAIQNEGDDILEVWNQGVLWWKKEDLDFTFNLTETIYGDYFILYSASNDSLFGYAIVSVDGNLRLCNIVSSDGENWNENYDITTIRAGASSYSDFIELPLFRSIYREDISYTASIYTSNDLFDSYLKLSNFQVTNLSSQQLTTSASYIRVIGKKNGVYLGVFIGQSVTGFFNPFPIRSNDLVNWYEIPSTVQSVFNVTSMGLYIPDYDLYIFVLNYVLYVYQFSDSSVSSLEQISNVLAYYRRPTIHSHSQYFVTYFDGYVLWGFHNSYSSQSSMLGVAGFDPSDIANTYFSVLGEDMGLFEFMYN